jgi:hypothetical protein
MKTYFPIFALFLAAAPIARPQSMQPIRVNCGGPAYTDSLGQVWAADGGFNSGSIFSTTAPISGTADSKLFQSERYGPALVYSFALPNGAYRVNLSLAEIWFKASGDRVMGMKLQGVTVFSGLDIFAAAGFGAALIKSADTAVTNGVLTIELDASVNNAKCSAIEILPGATLLRGKFTFDDGTAVAGSVAVFRIAADGTLISLGDFPLDATGFVSASLLLDPAAQYRGLLSDAAGNPLQELWTVNASAQLAAAAIAALSKIELDVTLVKATNAIKSIGPAPAP